MKPVEDLPDVLRTYPEIPSNLAENPIKFRGLRELGRDRFKVVGQVEPLGMHEAYADRIFVSREKYVPRQKKDRPPKAERILRLRSELGLDQVGFAQRLNVNQGTVSRWETGEAAPGPHTYKLLAELASGDLRELLLWDGGIQSGYADAGHLEGGAPAIDRGLLLFVVEIIEDELRKRRLKLSTKKYAEAVALSYDFCHKMKSRDADMVRRLLLVA